MNDLELEREIRDTFRRRGADIRDPEAVPPAREALRLTRRRQLTNVVTMVVLALALVGMSVAGVSAMIRSSERRIPIGPSETPSPTAIVGFACPAGSTPDQPGPVDQVRPPKDAYTYASTSFDPSSGQMIMLSADGAFWTFDVCANTWKAAPGPAGVSGSTEMVWDIDSELAIAIDREESVLRVWTHGSGGDTWTRKGQWDVGAIPEKMFGQPPQAVYDPVTGVVLVRDQFTSAMWTYDVDTDTWGEVDQGPSLPPAVEGTKDPAVELLTYDASADRLILYVSEPLGTWEFDVRASRWTEEETDTPQTGFGWFTTGEELAYDEANERCVLFSFGTLATYEASVHRWDERQAGGTDAAPGQTTRLYFAMTYDPVNGRIVIAGGDVRMSESKWHPTDDVIAFDVGRGEWITLLEPAARSA